MLSVDIVLFATGLVTFFLIFLVLSRNYKNPINQSFSIFLFSAAIWPFAIVLFRRANDPEVARFWDILIYLAANIVPAAYLYFSYIFSTKVKPSVFIILACVLVPLVFTAFLLFTDLWIVDVEINNFGNSVKLGPVYTSWMFYYGLFMTWGTIVFIRGFKESSGILKAQLRLVLIASLFPIVGAVLPNIILPFFRNYRLIFLGPIFTTAMNVIVSYAIVRHRLMDIRLVIARSISYTLLLLILGSFYAVGLFVFARFITKETTTASNLVVSTILALTMAFTFQYLKSILEKLTEKIFFKERYDSDQLLQDLSRFMASILDLDELTRGIIEILQTRIHISKAAFYILKKEGGVEGVYRDHGGSYLYPTSEELLKLRNGEKILVLDELEEGETKEIMRKSEVFVFIPLRTKEKLVGYLLLGEKSSGDIYFNEDISILEILGPEFAVALNNALAYREIQEFSRTLEKKVVERTAELKETQKRELAKANELLRLKDEFVFIATHDLRTPVTAIDGFVKLIEMTKEKFSEETRDSFRAIVEASNRLKQLVNDLLQVARSESGTIKVEVVPTDISDLVDRLVREVKPAADEKKVTIGVSLDKADRMVMADEQKLAEVVENLLSNAVKFNREGGNITVKTRKVDQYLQVDVANTGYAIPKEEQPKIFQKFFKYRGEETKNIPGTGLGLFVVRMLVEKMNGKITFTSEEGKETIFSFTLPLAKNG